MSRATMTPEDAEQMLREDVEAGDAYPYDRALLAALDARDERLRELAAAVRGWLVSVRLYLDEPTGDPAALADAREGVLRALNALSAAAQPPARSNRVGGAGAPLPAPQPPTTAPPGAEQPKERPMETMTERNEAGFNTECVASWFQVAEERRVPEARLRDTVREIIELVEVRAEPHTHAQRAIDRARALADRGEWETAVFALDCALARPTCACCDLLDPEDEQEAAGRALVNIALNRLYFRLGRALGVTDV